MESEHVIQGKKGSYWQHRSYDWFGHSRWQSQFVGRGLNDVGWKFFMHSLRKQVTFCTNLEQKL